MLATLLIAVLALLAESASPTRASETPKYHVGSRIMVVHETPLRVDDSPVKQLEPGTPLRVEELNDQGFLGVTAGRPGWVDAADVVPFAEALEPLSQLLSGDADNIQLHEARYLVAEAQKKWDVAIDDLTALIRLEPDKPEILIMRSDAWFENHQSDKALDDLNEAVRREENPAVALLKRGYLYSELKQPNKALADFNDALSHDLADAAKAEVLAYRGSVYMDQKETDKAFADFDQAIKLDPQNATIFVLRGSANSDRGKYDQAVSDYSAALWIEPTATNYVHRANAFWQNKELKAAESDFEKAIKINPSNDYAWTSRASFWVSQKDYDKAIADFSEAVKLEPTDALPLVDRADTYGLMKQYDKQLADYKTAIQIAPSDPLAYNNLAWILATCPEEKFRDGKQAIENAQKAVDLTDNKQGEYIDSLAAAYAEAGDFDKAAENQQKAIDMEKDDKTRKGMQSRLELFRNHKPYRETPGESDTAN
jgi:tetratricopeptide (TPR) repeat protein